MASTIISALLPIVVTLMLGYVAGWHQDFDSILAVSTRPRSLAVVTTGAFVWLAE